MKIVETKKIDGIEIAIVFCKRCGIYYKARKNRKYSICPMCKTQHNLEIV